MKVKTVSVTYGRKVNLGNYESLTADVTLWADVDQEYDDLDEAMSILWTMARGNVLAQIEPRLASQREIAKDVYLGLKEGRE